MLFPAACRIQSEIILSSLHRLAPQLHRIPAAPKPVFGRENPVLPAHPGLRDFDIHNKPRPAADIPRPLEGSAR